MPQKVQGNTSSVGREGNPKEIQSATLVVRAVNRRGIDSSPSKCEVEIRWMKPGAFTPRVSQPVEREINRKCFGKEGLSTGNRLKKPEA